MLMFHVTPTKNLDSILLDGLKPVEPDGLNFQEIPGVYLFPTRGDMDTALSSWFGELFEDDEEIAVLTIDVTDLPILKPGSVGVAPFEAVSLNTISPDRIVKVERGH